MRRLIAREFEWGVVDLLDCDSSGLFRVSGWLRGEIRLEELRVQLRIDRAEVPPLQRYRTFRPEVPIAASDTGSYCGFGIEFLLEGIDRGAHAVAVRVGEDEVFSEVSDFEVTRPDYGHLFSESRVLCREHIYGSGPPATAVVEEYLALAKGLPDPVLDFGCGAGLLVERLRDEGMEVYGLECERDAIIRFLSSRAEPFVTLYDGSFPLDLADGQFESVTAFEVIEHIPDYRTAFSEIARVTRKRFVMSVPDSSAIPLCGRHGVVPWHLLESTHYNFFTQRSLERELKRHFQRVSFARAGGRTVNDTQFFCSLVAICEKSG